MYKYDGVERADVSFSLSLMHNYLSRRPYLTRPSFHAMHHLQPLGGDRCRDERGINQLVAVELTKVVT